MSPHTSSIIVRFIFYFCFFDNSINILRSQVLMQVNHNKDIFFKVLVNEDLDHSLGRLPR